MFIIITMKNKKIKIGIITFLFFLGTLYLIFTGLKKTWVYYYTVEEFFQKNPYVDGKTIRLQGKVVPGTVNKKGNIVEFEIGNNENKIKVIYKGTAPDMLFQPEAQVVVEGVYYKADNLFKAHFLLTQCPSKYQAEEAKEK
ncbi:MAG: cytochrome c maturation protein CcmE [candidate division WOR-3 bacterium]